jgi:hypothetical protein
MHGKEKRSISLFIFSSPKAVKLFCVLILSSFYKRIQCVALLTCFYMLSMVYDESKLSPNLRKLTADVKCELQLVEREGKAFAYKKRANVSA